MPERLPTKREEGNFAIDVPTWTSYLYAPFLPLLKKIKIKREGSRGANPRDILLPQGYVAEIVATDFAAPDHCCFDDEGFCYVSECGHKVHSKPRIIKVNVETGEKELFLELPEDRWFMTGALTGACWHDGYLYFNNTDTLSRYRPGGQIEDIVTGLHGRGDHQANYPVVGPEGKIYFGMGSATNNGVVGADNFGYEWLPKFPDEHDVPARDVKLTGRNYEFRNVLRTLTETVRSGAFVPFGTETEPGQIIKGDVKCTGAVLRCDPEGSNLEVVAWGLRNPYGVAFDTEGKLFATEHGSDERGGRQIVDDLDDFYEITEGAWYGWPDFASGIRLDDPRWGEQGRGREPVLAEFPDPNPPLPFVSFETHAGANGVDFCRSDSFGFKGDAFVALFGDLFPLTSARVPTPVGFKVVRVDMRERRTVNFAVNRFQGPASKLPHEGFERPSHCQFGPDGALYVVDFGQIVIAPERGGVRMEKGTGALWRIRRTEGPRGLVPPRPIVIPANALHVALAFGAGIGLAVGGGWLLKRLLGGKKKRSGGRSTSGR